jgi:hypothetical protein
MYVYSIHATSRPRLWPDREGGCVRAGWGVKDGEAADHVE